MQSIKLRCASMRRHNGEFVLQPRRSALSQQHRRGVTVVQRATSDRTPQQQGSQAGEPRYAYSDPVNAFLGRFLPSSRAAVDELAGVVDFDAPKATGLTPQQMAQAVEAGLIATEWFVTGAVDARLFSDNFVFRDESVSTSGLRAYALGVRRLFDQASARCELVSVDVAAPQQQQQQQQQQLTVVWRLTGRVNLLWQPEIKPYVVTTTFTLEERTGLIVEQDDAFAVPGWDLLLSALLGHWLGAPPAPPVAELRAVAKRTTSAAA